MIIILEIVSGIVALITTIFVILIGLNVLHSKSDIGETLFTDEQKIKVYYYRLFMISFILFIEAICILTICSIAMGNEDTFTNSEIIITILFLAVAVFFLSIFSMGRIARWYQNIFVKHHYKFRFTLSNGDQLYIIRMLNSEVCICSKDPYAGFKKNSKKTFLVPIQSIMEQPLIKIKFPMPKQSVFQNFYK